jgi:NhaP-type Na+/H+ or K+/H+ antiporter
MELILIAVTAVFLIGILLSPAVILFAGGLETDFRDMEKVWAPALLLVTVGVCLIPLRFPFRAGPFPSLPGCLK